MGCQPEERGQNPPDERRDVIDARWRQRIRVQWDADGVGVPDPGQEDRDE